jgi:hypothetical protein
VFPPGILALAPNDKAVSIQNSEYVNVSWFGLERTDMCSIERLYASKFDAFGAVLVEDCGEFIKNVSAAASHSISDILNQRDLQSRYRFKKVDAVVKDSYSLKLLRLIKLP